MQSLFYYRALKQRGNIVPLLAGINVPKNEVQFVSIIKMQIPEFEAHISFTFYKMILQNHSYSFGPFLEISPQVKKHGPRLTQQTCKKIALALKAAFAPRSMLCKSLLVSKRTSISYMFIYLQCIYLLYSSYSTLTFCKQH